MKIGSLCSGYGGLDLAVERFYGGNTIWHAETEPAAARVLARHWPGVPNLGDLTRIDWATIEPPDVLCAGFPCQPFSVAGLRKSENDERAIFGYIADAISVLRPGTIVLENVPGILDTGGPGIIAALTSLRYDCRWGIVRASDVGAPHKRARWFCVATDSCSERYGRRQNDSMVGRLDREDRGPRRQSEHSNEALADTYDGGQSLDGPDSGKFRERQHKELNAKGSSKNEALENAYSKQEWSRAAPGVHAQDTTGRSFRPSRPVSSFGEYEPAVRRWEQILRRPAPNPVDDHGLLNPRFVEWMMGLNANHVCNHGLSRAQELKMLGNGVVPAQALLALETLNG